MDLKHYPRRHYEIDQFTQPHCTELKGSKFYFVMDDGRDFELNFTGEDTLEWNWAGENQRKPGTSASRATIPPIWWTMNLKNSLTPSTGLTTFSSLTWSKGL